MTITLKLPPESEASLIAQAEARGLTLDVFVKTLITNQAAAKPMGNLPRNGEELDRVIDEVFDTVQLPPGVGKGAMRRENWYR